MKRYAVSGLLVCMAIAMAFGADIYVSPSGNDAAAGTPTAPLATLRAARDKADALKSGGPVNVFLMKGTYYLGDTVVFGPSNSGTASAPITYRAYNGKVVISGGLKVTTPWTASTGSVMVTTLPANLKVDQLFLNGKRQVMARYPNYNPKVAILEGYGTWTNISNRTSKWATPTEGPGYIRGLHNSQWGGEDYKISSVSGTTINTSWVGDNNRGSTVDKNHCIVENIYEELDTVGEWYYKKSTGQLFFWPPAGTDLNASTNTVELASLDGLIRFVGSGATTAGSVQYITFDGISFTHTYRTLFSGTFELITKSDWAIVRNGAVFMQNAENITIKNCLFDQIGGNGVFLSGYCRHCVVYNNDFEDVGASCVCLFGLRSSMRCPNSWSSIPSCTDKTPGPKTEEYPGSCVISNNLMNHLGRFEKQTSGVTLSAAMDDTIIHNTIHDIPRAGINFCDGCFGGHVVAWNWVYNCVQETSDHGPFNAWGRDRNLILGSSSDTTGSLLDAWRTTYVYQNRFEAPAGMFGIDLDDQASNYYQYYNLLMGGGHKLQWNRYNTYLNNIILRYGNVQFHGVWSNCHHYGARNIIVGTQTCVEQLLSGNSAASTYSAGVKWDSNFVHSTAGAPTISQWSQNQNCGTSVCNWATWVGAGLDVHSDTSNIGFTDTQKVWRDGYLPRGDFNPPNGSIAYTKGFKAFVMDSFGVMGVPGPQVGVKNPSPMRQEVLENRSLAFNGATRRLSISYGGEYRVSIVSIAGRTIESFNGKGHSEFILDPQRIRSGMYIAIVRTKNGLVSKRFVIGK